MKFGKIDYLNLAPFDVFLKRYPMSGGAKAFVAHKKSYPAALNRDFLFGRIDASFISSIAGMDAHYRRRGRGMGVGIIADGAVWSVLLLPNAPKSDYQSASSNALAKVLNLSGEVLIGDRALRHKFSAKECLDMGALWHKKHGLPFVFGRLCATKHTAFFEQLARSFASRKVKIPHYLLARYSETSALPASYIRAYLRHIYYKIGPRELAGLERFYRAVRIKGIKRPGRF